MIAGDSDSVIFDLDGTPADVGFPETRFAEKEPNGLLAIGGDLSEQRVIDAYRRGIFPWYNPGQPILWWSPAPRMVMYPAEFHVSRSLRKTLRRNAFAVSVNQAFDEVIRACAAPRDAVGGTWLLPEMIASYSRLHDAGYAQSVEVWAGDELAGGLYGIALGRVFFGESMFSRRRDASKVAMAMLTELALERGILMIDCQIYTGHLASLGAREIDRDTFQQALADAVADRPMPFGILPMRRSGSLRWAA